MRVLIAAVFTACFASGLAHAAIIPISQHRAVGGQIRIADAAGADEATRSETAPGFGSFAAGIAPRVDRASGHGVIRASQSSTIEPLRIAAMLAVSLETDIDGPNAVLSASGTSLFDLRFFADAACVWRLTGAAASSIDHESGEVALQLLRLEGDSVIPIVEIEAKHDDVLEFDTTIELTPGEYQFVAQPILIAVPRTRAHEESFGGSIGFEFRQVPEPGGAALIYVVAVAAALRRRSG